MSMHGIERLVEVSVITAAAAPLHPMARDICYSLYRLQDQFDCGYTLLRVPEELERVGYLFRVSVQRLPEPEQTQALEYRDTGGFFADEAYFDHETGLACVTAGSVLWKKLCNLGVLPNPEKRPPRELGLLELAEALFPLAAKALSAGEAYGAETLGLWYAQFPMFCGVCGDIDPSPERIARLLQIAAVPEAFAFAQSCVCAEDFEDMEEELPFLSGWGAPYLAWVNRRDNEKNDTQQILSLVAAENYAQAALLAQTLSETNARTYYQSFVSMNYNQWCATQTESPCQPEGILTPAEARDGFLFLLAQDGNNEQEISCTLYLSCCQLLLGEIPAAAENFVRAFQLSLSRLEQTGDKFARRYQQAFIALSFYLLLDGNFPDSFAGKQPMLEQGIPGMMKIPEVRQILEELTRQQPKQCAFYDNIAQCYLLEKNIPKAREALNSALKIDPRDALSLEILQSLDTPSS